MKDILTKIEFEMEYYRVVTSKGKVFENVRAEDIIYSHKMGKIRGRSKIQDSEGKWYKVEEFIKNYKKQDEEKFKRKSNFNDQKTSNKLKVDLSRGNSKILDILAGRTVPGQNLNKKSFFKKYVLAEGRVFLLAFICLCSILLNVGLVFYYDLGKGKDAKFDIGKKEFVIGKKEVKNKKAALLKTKNDKKEFEEVAKKAELYYRGVDQKSYDEEKGKILLYEKARIDK
jgi:hypothetical protein